MNTQLVKRAVLFDLGDTLVGYYRRGEFRPVLDRCIRAVDERIRALDLPSRPVPPTVEDAWSEGSEAPDHRVRPLEDRLTRIFGLEPGRVNPKQWLMLAEAFLAPIFALAEPYPDALPALRALRERGLKLGVISNTPWGSPASLWRQEVDRHGIGPLCDYVGFCVECGWRKPASEPFDRAMRALDVKPSECLFVGDDPRWDVIGANAAGLQPVLVDRYGRHSGTAVTRIGSLSELPPLVDA